MNVDEEEQRNIDVHHCRLEEKEAVVLSCCTPVPCGFSLWGSAYVERERERREEMRGWTGL